MHEFRHPSLESADRGRDIGQVSFQNDLYVLDFYGLASAQRETLTVDGDACSRVNISKVRAVSATNP